MKRIVNMSVLLLASFLLLAGCGRKEYRDGMEGLKNGEYEAAVSHLENAIEEKVNIGDSWRGIGLAKWELEDYEGASEALVLALDNGAQKTGAIYNLLGACMLKLGDPAAAISYYEQGISQEDCADEMLKEMKFNVIAAYEKLEDWENAKEKLSEYTEEYPDDGQAAKEAEFLETR